ncbi:MAG: hypothetical protein RIE56_07365, partial [Amphiplicatus sp.]
SVSFAEEKPAYQPPDIALQKEKVGAFSALEGDWQGEGWMYGGDGKKREFIQKEEVRFMLDGAILVVHGTGRSKGAAPETKPDFEAFAIISWDEKAGAYRFRSYANGHYGEFPITPLDGGGFEWTLPGVRYEATVSDGSWTEKGFRAGPGEPVQFFEMTVTRQ